jgi:hypothetical protein
MKATEHVYVLILHGATPEESTGFIQVSDKLPRVTARDVFLTSIKSSRGLSRDIFVGKAPENVDQALNRDRAMCIASVVHISLSQTKEVVACSKFISCV